MLTTEFVTHIWVPGMLGNWQEKYDSVYVEKLVEKNLYIYFIYLTFLHLTKIFFYNSRDYLFHLFFCLISAEGM